MEHLLSGIAAVEEKAKRADDENQPPSNTTPHAAINPGDELPASTTLAPSPTTSVKREPNLAKRTTSLPLPKLPPISSLTYSHGVASPLLPSQAKVPAVTTASAVPPRPSTGSLATHDEGLCRYRNKLCMHARALKRNGELHNLCEKHRAKANQNQRKLESKRRVQKRHSRQPVPVAVPHQRSYDGAPVMTSATMHMHHQIQQQQHLHHQSPLQLRSAPGMLPSLAQLQHLPPRPSSTGSASGQGCPPFDSAFR